MSGCQKIGEYYLGLNMQPELPREDFQPGLNIYGVLKTGDDFDTLNHYFEVEQLIYVMDSFDSVYVSNASINLTRLTFEGKQTSYQLKHYHDGVYLNTDIEILPGERWTYQCNYDTFEVTADCYIPNAPRLKGAANITT